MQDWPRVRVGSGLLHTAGRIVRHDRLRRPTPGRCPRSGPAVCCSETASKDAGLVPRVHQPLCLVRVWTRCLVADSGCASLFPAGSTKVGIACGPAVSHAMHTDKLCNSSCDSNCVMEASGEVVLCRREWRAQRARLQRAHVWCCSLDAGARDQASSTNRAEVADYAVHQRDICDRTCSPAGRSCAQGGNSHRHSSCRNRRRRLRGAAGCTIWQRSHSGCKQH